MTDPYTQVGLDLPNDIGIGGALITMVEPNPGHEHDYNRWYEDDHFYSGAMHGPWHFAGRRFVAPRDLRERRATVDHSAVQPPDAGCYISCYWITAGHEEDAERWSYVAMNDALMPQGRGFQERTHVYTAFHRYHFGLTRDTSPLKPFHALNAPFRGLVVEIVDAPTDEGLAPLEAWLKGTHLPLHLAGSPAAMVLAFTPVAFTQGRINFPGVKPVEPPEALGRRLCLLWFLDDDPHELNDEGLRTHHEGIASSGLGTLSFSGAFVPTVVGTDRYVDELR